MKIAVVGAGINGLACAVKIKEKYRDFEVVIISSEFTPNTTGDGSGGLWYPYLTGDNPHNLLEKWSGETYRFLHKLWKSGGHNICLMPMYNLYREKERFKRPAWCNTVYGYQELNSKQLEYFSNLYSARYTAGQTFISFISSPPKMLAYLQERFVKGNGQLLRAKVTSLEDPLLQEYDVVVNCTGIQARFIVPDEKVRPYRGQIVKVKAPWVLHTIIDEDGSNYIIPNAATVVLGGTYQNDFNRQIDPKDTDFILNGCQRILPGLKDAEIVNVWVGLRPGRNAIRLEPEVRNGKLFIHNYGHGGGGLTLFWGCGDEVLQILETHLNKPSNVKSKL
ncbi:D-amino-acid oxidase [Trichoplusia ni]|uniref:D-amino-acid oxidase n=1 Tax=Trichoplusia ni TaxID=7111 RepID=A0A7E5VH48_TRINI|nr:D-amino-acid oxidase [Trichoplusia ni]